jgi:hypothetical protein
MVDVPVLPSVAAVEFTASKCRRVIDDTRRLRHAGKRRWERGPPGENLRIRQHKRNDPLCDEGRKKHAFRATTEHHG